jgi:hypothetical protein
VVNVRAANDAAAMIAVFMFDPLISLHREADYAFIVADWPSAMQ